MIVYARFSETRYFCWAPHDAQTAYELSVTLNGRPLNAEEIKQRYRLDQKGIDPRSIEHVKIALRQYETTYGKDDTAAIIMHYATNGGPPKIWRWEDHAAP